MNKEQLREEFKRKFGNTFDYTEEHTDWWLDKLEQSHKELIEKIESRRKPTHENNHSIPLRGTMIYERNFNEGLDVALSIIHSNNKSNE